MKYLLKHGSKSTKGKVVVRRRVLTQEARAGMMLVSSFIKHNFSQEQANLFLNGLEKALKILSIHPDRFPLANGEKDRTLRLYHFKRKTLIYYRFTDTELILIAIRDARQEPFL